MDAAWFTSPRNFGGLEGPEATLAGARVVILPVPYDSTTCYKPGAREGARALVDASLELELFDHELGREIAAVGIHTLPELEPQVGDPEAMLARVSAVTRSLLDAGKLVVLLGGEHSLSAGAARAHAERYADLTVLYLDAHADLRDTYQGTRFSHACTARRIAEFAPLVQVGVRSLSREEHDFLRTRPDIVTFYAEDGPLDGPAVERIVAALGSRVYISIDLDVLDPALMSAVGTPEPGGLTWDQTLRLLRTVAQRREIVGFDVVELSPPQGPLSCVYTAAKLTYKLIGYATHPWEPPASP
ncbi:MAG: agmatinase [Chloroflexi bacterium]|nr:agmatinase [Chloroflexota bacterium]